MKRLDDDDQDFLDTFIHRTGSSTPSEDRRDTVVSQLKILIESEIHADHAKAMRIAVWALQRPVLERINYLGRLPRVQVKMDGELTSLPTNYAAKHLNEKSGAWEKAMQTSFLDLSWPEFDAKRFELETSWRALGRTVRAFNKLAALHEKYPETKTPREACVAAGMDPDELLRFEESV